MIEIDYTNHKGERRVRRIIPKRTYVGHTQYHPDTQTLLVAHDPERNVERTFAVRNIHELRVKDDAQETWGALCALTHWRNVE